MYIDIFISLYMSSHAWYYFTNEELCNQETEI